MSEHGLDRSHALPRQQYTDVTAQGFSRIHNGNSYVQQQNNYYASEKTLSPTALSLKDALEYPEMSLRSDNIATPLSRSCEWLFDTSAFKRWRDPVCRTAHHGILWIRGKPGAGKSTIMKHALRHAQGSMEAGTIISFFFNARGHDLGKSTEGMYRSLIHQMIDDRMIGDLRPFKGRHDDVLKGYKERGWPRELLKESFCEAALVSASKHGLICYIDALDECDEDEVRDMLVLLEDLGEKALERDLNFAICFASRHYPNVTPEIERHGKEMGIGRGNQTAGFWCIPLGGLGCFDPQQGS